MASNQPTQAQLQAMQLQRNADFMRLSHMQYLPANPQNSNVFGSAKTINFNVPIIAGGFATELTFRVKMNFTTAGTTGSLKTTASYPYSLINRIRVLFGNEVQNMHPYVAYVRDLLQGYARQAENQVLANKSTVIDGLLNKVPDETALAANGTFDLDFEFSLPLNALHEGSINGIVPLYSAGTTLQAAVSTAQNLVGNDALDNPFWTDGDHTVTVNSGTVECYVGFRDYTSFYTTQAIQPDLTGIDSVAVVELPSISNLSQGTMNYASFRNPYLTASIIHFVIDGKSPDKFSSADNISAFTYDKAENSNSSFIRFDATNNNLNQFYKAVRSIYGQDLPEGILAFDAPSGLPGRNLANVSAKGGTNYLNLIEYPAARFGVTVNSVDATKTTPRVVSFAYILNKGIQAR